MVTPGSFSKGGNMAALTLIPLDGLFGVCRLAADTPLPAWAEGGPFVSITRTADELSIACRQEVVPDDVRCERGWRCLRVAGTLDFALVSVLASLLVPLANAGIAVFVVSTFDTDYLLAKEGRWDAAIAILRRVGHSVSSA
jgi:hypothetical protein